MSEPGFGRRTARRRRNAGLPIVPYNQFDDFMSEFIDEFDNKFIPDLVVEPDDYYHPHNQPLLVDETPLEESMQDMLYLSKKWSIETEEKIIVIPIVDEDRGPFSTTEISDYEPVSQTMEMTSDLTLQLYMPLAPKNFTLDDVCLLIELIEPYCSMLLDLKFPQLSVEIIMNHVALYWFHDQEVIHHSHTVYCPKCTKLMVPSNGITKRRIINRTKETFCNICFEEMRSNGEVDWPIMFRTIPLTTYQILNPVVLGLVRRFSEMMSTNGKPIRLIK
jgi:hypothetical protein